MALLCADTFFPDRRWIDRSACRSAVAPCPGDAAGEGDRAAERRDHHGADDQADQQDADAEREAERRDTGLARVRLGVHQSTRTAAMSSRSSTVLPTTTLPVSSIPAAWKLISG
jgi:hypothetical protein